MFRIVIVISLRCILQPTSWPDYYRTFEVSTVPQSPLNVRQLAVQLMTKLCFVLSGSQFQSSCAKDKSVHRLRGAPDDPLRGATWIGEHDLECYPWDPPQEVFAVGGEGGCDRSPSSGQERWVHNNMMVGLGCDGGLLWEKFQSFVKGLEYLDQLSDH
jgi:hypothetical protein